MTEKCDEIVEIAEGPSICIHSDKQPAEHHATSVRQELAYGIKVWVERPYNEVLEAVRKEIKNQRLDLISELDLRNYIETSLGIAIPHHHILSVCSPDLAYRSYSLDKDLGLLIPVNIVVYEQGDGTIIECIDPILYFGITDGKGVEKLSRELKSQLEDVISHVASGIV
jgi:uncharacterized protein (DUF302 family)